MRLPLLASLFLVPAAFAQLEGTARLPFDPTRNLEAMRMIPNCPPGTPVAVSGTRLVCAPVTSVDIQMGRAGGPNGSVRFPRPFASVPRVFIFIERQTEGGPCRGYNNQHLTPFAENVTASGFSFTGFSWSSGCSWGNLDTIQWIAIAP